MKKLIIRIIKKTAVFVKFCEYIDINILLELRLKVNLNKNEILFQLFVRLLFRV